MNHTTTTPLNERAEEPQSDRRRKGIVILLAVGSVALFAGAAYALWSATTNEADGQAQAVDAQDLVLTATAGVADLYPGFTGGDLSFTVTNPNPYAVDLDTLTVGVITSSAPVLCPATNITVATTFGGASVAAEASGEAIDLTDVVTMVAAAPDGCQGVTFTIPVTLSGTQVAP